MIKKSMRFKHIIKIKNDIMSILDNNQEIKRLCKYLTPNPLAKSVIINKTRKSQPDIKDSLLKENLIPYGFDDNLLTKQQVYIFCELRNIVFGNKSNMDVNLFVITIFVPLDSNELELYGDERIIAIASRIVDELDGTSLNKGMSNINIKPNGVCNYARYDKRDFLVLTIPFEILTSSGQDY